MARSITIERPTKSLGDSIDGLKAVACSMIYDNSKIEDVVSKNLDVSLFRKTEEEIATGIRPNKAVRTGTTGAFLFVSSYKKKRRCVTARKSLDFYPGAQSRRQQKADLARTSVLAAKHLQTSVVHMANKRLGSINQPEASTG
jgi:hypothetical protein